jgi:oligosaccharide reducing-end xylanase
MKKIVVSLALMALGICLAQALTGTALSAQTSSTKPASVSIVPHPGDGVGAYATGNYRDLFKEQGHSPEETRAKIDKAFQQLFHGDAVSERVYFEAGTNQNGPLAYITDWANNDARSEGMSYGMMIAVQMDKKREFDALWNWSNTYMLITDKQNPNVGYYAWSMNTDGTPRSTGPAPDGEQYYAMALLFAAHRWGNGTGIYNYQEQAERILREMRHHPIVSGTEPFKIHPDDPPMASTPSSFTSPNNVERQQANTNLAIERGEKPHAPNFPHFGFGGNRGPSYSGPMVNETYFMVRFLASKDSIDTDPSYHLPAFYELFARWGPEEDRQFWATAADASRGLFYRVVDQKTGLSPDRNNMDGSPLRDWNGKPAAFGYDSWRTISNWSVDYSWWRKEPHEIELSDRVQRFLIQKGISTFSDRYTLDGEPLSTRHSTGMVAAATVGSLSASNKKNARDFVDELWRTPTPVGDQRYFDGMLYIMSMLHCSGNFRIWMPK